MELIEALLELEAAAATVESYLPDADDAELAELLAPWGPPPRRGRGTSAKSRQSQAEDWVAWLKDCAERWEARPPAHPSGEALGGLLIRWAQLSQHP